LRTISTIPAFRNSTLASSQAWFQRYTAWFVPFAFFEV
jgi:hypothetical protein